MQRNVNEGTRGGVSMVPSAPLATRPLSTDPSEDGGYPAMIPAFSDGAAPVLVRIPPISDAPVTGLLCERARR